MREKSFGLAPKRAENSRWNWRTPIPACPASPALGKLPPSGQNLTGGESHPINSLRVLQTFRKEVICN